MPWPEQAAAAPPFRMEERETRIGSRHARAGTRRKMPLTGAECLTTFRLVTQNRNLRLLAHALLLGSAAVGF